MTSIHLTTLSSVWWLDARTIEARSSDDIVFENTQLRNGASNPTARCRVDPPAKAREGVLADGMVLARLLTSSLSSTRSPSGGGGASDHLYHVALQLVIVYTHC